MADHHPNLEPRLSGGPRPWAQYTLDCDAIERERAQRLRENAAVVQRMTTRLARKSAVEGCDYCAAHAGEMIMPPHDASPRCESGGHNHCTCDTCF